MANEFKIEGTARVPKLYFTPNEKLSLIAESLMQEFTPDDPEKIESFWDLFSYLHREKERILKLLLNGDSQDRQILWPQLDEVKKDLAILEFYLEIHLEQDKL